MTLPTGIRLERGRYRAYVRVKGRLIARRFADGTTLEAVLAWRELAHAAATVKALTQPPPDPAKSLKRDLKMYLRLKRKLPTYDTRRQMMADWLQALGETRDRCTVTPSDVAAVLAEWEAAYGYAASTLNHYRSALSDFYNRMDPDGANPVKGVPKRREPQQEPRALDPAVVQALFAAMPPGKAHAMMQVMYATGLRPAQVRKVTRLDLDLGRKRMLAPGRSKGAGTGPRWKPLTDLAVEAWHAYDRMNGWSGVRGVTLLIVFRRAAAVVRREHPDWYLPAEASPYWLIHSVGTEMYAATGDLAQTQLFMGHKDPRTTLRYVGGAIGRVERRSVSALNRALKGVKLPGPVTHDGFLA